MSDRKPTFFTSDWHIGHANSIKFDQRPFSDLEHMHRVLVNNYNSTVPEHGVCYFLGDVGLASAEKTRAVISRLHGTKILILGNHDKGANAMYNIGFDVVVHGATLVIAGELVTLTHCPLRGTFREATEGMNNSDISENWHGENRHKNFSTENFGQFHLHGHIHSPNGGKSTKILGKQMDVGVPANDYKPVSISAIESWITNYSKKRMADGLVLGLQQAVKIGKK